MKKKVFIFLILSILLLPTVTGLGAATSNKSTPSGQKVSASVNHITIITGRTKKISVGKDGKTIKTIRMTGPATITNRKQTPQNIILTIKAPNSVPSSRTASLRIIFSDNSNKIVTIHIYPQAHPTQTKVNSKIRKQAQKYDKLKSEWLKKSTRMVPLKNGKGVAREYFQYDPTKGPLNKNGVPQGKMVRVNVYPKGSQKAGQPEWLYNNLSQEFMYTAKKGRSRKSTENAYLIGTIVFVVLVELVARVILPTYQKYKEESMMYSMSPGQLIWSRIKFW